jgi:hypothetical protein
MPEVTVESNLARPASDTASFRYSIVMIAAAEHV